MLYKFAITPMILLALSAGSGWAQPYTDTERVTAIDLAVELRSVFQNAGRVRKPPGNLRSGEFQLLIDGLPQTIVALAPVSAMADKPYQILIYVDPALSNSRELQCSIDLLLSDVGQLTDIGLVDLVVADPEPRFVLRDVSNPELLENLLAASDWQNEAEDQIRALRVGFIQALADTESEVRLQDLQVAFAREEQRLAQERLDLLLSFVANRETTGRQKVLLVAGLQFDLDPSAYYSSWGDPTGPGGGHEESPESQLDQRSRSVAATLAAYGWIGLPIAPPPEEGLLVPGLRLGKWRLAGPAGGRILGVKITRESERDPELAEAHLERGRSLLSSGQVKESEEAFRRALHHFYGDPRTAVQQAEALVGLADALQEQGREDEARAARALASEMDASVVADDPTVLATLLDPTRVLELLAEETSGRVLRQESDLQSGLFDLQRRLRLTFQIRGNPQGQIYPVEARILRNGWVLHSPRWVRSGTPPTVPFARTRLLVSGDLAEPTLILDARIQQLPQSDLVSLEFQLPLGVADEERLSQDGQDCRITAAWLEEDEILRIDQRGVQCSRTDEGLTGLLEMRIPSESGLAAILVENLVTGDWGAEIFEIEPSAN